MGQTEDNADDQTAPMTIKAVPVSAREVARASASRAGLNMGAWIANAIHAQARLDAGNAVLPPVGRMGEGYAQEPANLTQPESPIAAVSTFADLRDMMQAAAFAAQASGQPMPKRSAGRLYRFIDDQVRAASGLPPRKPGKTRLNGAPESALSLAAE